MRTVPWTEDPDFLNILKSRPGLSSRQIIDASFYNQNGYLVVENSDILDEIDINSLKKQVEQKYNYTSRRLQDAWQFCPEVKNIACNPKVLDTLEFLYEREAVPFQTLNFINGTEQLSHSDSIHFSSLPARYMCGVWVALEDITARQGPLHYYPGSQRMKEYDYQDLGLELINGASPGGFSWGNEQTKSNYRLYEEAIHKLAQPFPYKELAVKKGSFLIWSSNLIHGGTKIMDSASSRWSHVTHYYFKDTISITPMFSDMVNEEYVIRNVINIKSGIIKPNTLNGTPVTFQPVGHRHKVITTPDVPRFSEEAAREYLLRYPDVAGSSYGTLDGAYAHFLSFGRGEGRQW